MLILRCFFDATRRFTAQTGRVTVNEGGTRTAGRREEGGGRMRERERELLPWVKEGV